jgi:hypothetical protein
MSIMRLLISFLFLLVTISATRSQTSPKISNPQVELQGNRVRITYNIEDYYVSDKFNVWIEITDTDGKPIEARTLTGDLGHHINGGKGKEIIWDPEIDGITLEVGINVQLFATLEEPPPINTRSEASLNEKKVNTMGIMMQSFIFPGLGLSRTTGHPHWLRGLGGYSCIISSVVLNRLAVNNFEAYKKESEITKRNELFETSLAQDNISEVLAYAAIGIWLSDVLWNIVKCSSMNRSLNSPVGSISLKPQYDPNTRTPVMAVRISF